MKCEDLEERIALHITDDLPPGQAASVKAHLDACSRCQELADGLRRTARALESLKAEEADEPACREVRRRVLERLRSGDVRRLPVNTPWRWAVAAALFLFLALPIAFRERKTDLPAPLVPVAPEVGRRPPETVASAPTVNRTPAKLASRHRKAEGSAELLRRKVATTPREPMVVKLLTDDPDVVIYWLVEQNGG
jgi:anti-sigma factor RsiW